MSRQAAKGMRRDGAIRCAIYSLKASEEGLEQEFNSLQAQREACEAFIKSQRHEGWVCPSDGYDDGGFSGATMERPALQQLLAEIQAGPGHLLVRYQGAPPPPPPPRLAQICSIPPTQGGTLTFVPPAF